MANVESATGTAAKRAYSNTERFSELDRALRRPRRIIWAFCSHHGSGYYFFDIRVVRLKPADQERWADEPQMRRVHALCMWCQSESTLYLDTDELAEHRYHPMQLCGCGLPDYHQRPPIDFLRQYNARPVPCRNGRTNV